MGKTKLTHGQFFAGVSGFGFAAEHCDIENVWANEIDPFCCEVLRKRFPKLKVYEEDIRKFNRRKNVQPVDIISGGFPCQPFSNAGKRKGTKDNRYLWPEMLKAIKKLKPYWVIGENVAGIETMENSTPFEQWVLLGMESKNFIRRIYSRYIYRKRQTFVLVQILKSIEEIGYQVEVYNIPASATGAWHQRQRVWIIAHHPDPRNEGVRKRKNQTPEG